MVQEVEAYQGKSENPQARGYEGIIPVTQRPADRQASGTPLEERSHLPLAWSDPALTSCLCRLANRCWSASAGGLQARDQAARARGLQQP